MQVDQSIEQSAQEFRQFLNIVLGDGLTMGKYLTDYFYTVNTLPPQNYSLDRIEICPYSYSKYKYMKEIKSSLISHLINVEYADRSIN